MTERIAVILAAGKGTRMKSDLPKVLHQVAGRAMVDWSIDLAETVGCSRVIVVCSPGQGQLMAHVTARLGEGSIAIQEEPLGTGHAVQAAEGLLAECEGTTVVLYGDTPLIQPAAITELIEGVETHSSCGVLGFEAADPGAYGRLILADNGQLMRIVEAKDADPDELAVTLCNSGVMAVNTANLFHLLNGIDNDNAKGEYYLTDIVGMVSRYGETASVVVCDEADVQGVNSRAELAVANAAFQARRRAQMMADGVTLEAPETVFFSHDTDLGRDVLVEPNVVFGTGVSVASGAIIRAFSHLEGATVESGAVIGPYARLRPGADIGEDCKVGNFVEVKKTRMDSGAKANHLAYLGDGHVGEGANIGAGTIFCNYDGFKKARTEVGVGAFVGSNSSLVAPVQIGDGAYVGSGSVITKDVSDDALAVARGRQKEIEGWAVQFRAKQAKLASED